MHFLDIAKTIVTLCIKDKKMLGLETNVERTRPIPHQLETKTMSLGSRPRSKPRPQEIGFETYITVKYTFKYIWDDLLVTIGQILVIKATFNGLQNT